MDPIQKILWGAGLLLGTIASLWIMEEKFFKSRKLYWHRGLRRLAKVIALVPIGYIVVYSIVLLTMDLWDEVTFLPDRVYILFPLWVFVVWITYLLLKYIMTGLTQPRKRSRDHKKQREKELKQKQDKEGGEKLTTDYAD